jgi:hypothetical protein
MSGIRTSLWSDRGRARAWRYFAQRLPVGLHDIDPGELTGAARARNDLELQVELGWIQPGRQQP